MRNREADTRYQPKASGENQEISIFLKELYAGKYPLFGYGAMIRGIFGLPYLPHRIKSISNQEREQLYFRTKIGFNMHLSDKRECGNLRTYEVPFHGCMLLSNKAGADGHNQIFEDNKEAVYYESIEDAIEKIEFYLKSEDERIKIAKTGFERAYRDYNPQKVLKEMLQWACSLKSI